MMKIKKQEARFTIQFNLDNPRHKEAVKILNEVGRNKAMLIAEALYVYSRYVSNAINHIGNNTSKPSQHEVIATIQKEFEVSEIAPLIENSVDIDTTQTTEDDVWQTVNESLGAFF